MKNDYSSPKYDEVREWIRARRESGKDWDFFYMGDKENHTNIEAFLKNQRDYSDWQIENAKEFLEIVESEKNGEEETKNYEYVYGQANILKEKNNGENQMTIPKSQNSMWQLYREYLLKEKGFKKDTVDGIEEINLKILRQLKSDTSDTGAVKGLVIGNVQSGKTANMAALMSMAADWGWNMFIILSGTIENLRKQTQKRMISDLNRSGGNCTWIPLEHLKKSDKSISGTEINDLSNLHFNENNRERYFTVCLKNTDRLQHLLNWINSDNEKREQMKILIIDDEADQAGINTEQIDKKNRAIINGHLVNLVEGRDKNGNCTSSPYKAMNYIGYTATPYANMLNEGSEESLYPKDFISILPLSEEYFGPQQIFGVDDEDYDGMDIIRIVKSKDIELLKQIYESKENDDKEIIIPTALENAIFWFLCGAATMRIQGYKKPISMLVHTSEKQNHHQAVADAINAFFENNNKEDIIKKCEEIWKIETKFTKDKFRSQYKNYARSDKEIKDYPKFDEIVDEIKILLHDISNIPLNEDGELTYHEGIHLCIDNCSNKSGINSNRMFVRLAYPSENMLLNKAPAFIVIGGATLSRGLTIEGLISTFFLRSAKQADSLMQMGRWFGYRKNYELIPRIWITSNTKKQFTFLSTLDFELRKEIAYMEKDGKTPKEFRPKIKNSPKKSFIKITAENKRQQAKDYCINFCGFDTQTTIFDNNKNDLLHNIKITEEFIEHLGKPVEKQKHNEHCIVWKNIDFEIIKSELLQKFRFCNKSDKFKNLNELYEWVKKSTQDGELLNWNVILAGKKRGNSDEWKINDVSVSKIERSRKKILSNDEKDLIRIGTLRRPVDILADIDTDNVAEYIKTKIENFESKENALHIRNESKMNYIPQLIIYRIDKNSKVRNENENREALNSEEDIIGLCITVPGEKDSYRFNTYLRLDDEFMKSTDIYED